MQWRSFTAKKERQTSYAFRTINAAARRAEELIKTAPEEPGPYFQTLAHTTGGATTDSVVATQGLVDIMLLRLQMQLLKLQTIELSLSIAVTAAYLAFTYPEFAYNVGYMRKRFRISY